jgi:aquaporin NIP
MRKALCELLGTFILVAAGTGAIVVNAQTGALTHVGVALVFGLIVTVLVYALGPASGAHLNPAVTLAMLARRTISLPSAVAYILAQCGGAILASLFVLLCIGSEAHLGATLPRNSAAQSFVLEFFLTAVLLYVIMHVTTGPNENNSLAGVAIGATIGLEALFAGPICGASMNPARSLGPALVSGHLTHLWLYLIAPVTGALTGLLLWKLTKPARAD